MWRFAGTLSNVASCWDVKQCGVLLGRQAMWRLAETLSNQETSTWEFMLAVDSAGVFHQCVGQFLHQVDHCRLLQLFAGDAPRQAVWSISLRE